MDAVRFMAAALFSAAAVSAALPYTSEAANSMRPTAATASSFSSAQHPLLLRLAGGGLRPRDDVKRMDPVEASPPFQGGDGGSSIDSEVARLSFFAKLPFHHTLFFLVVAVAAAAAAVVVVVVVVVLPALPRRPVKSQPDGRRQIRRRSCLERNA